MAEQNQSNATWLHSIVSLIGAAFLYFVGKTAFIQKWAHPSTLSFRRQKKPCVYAFWHNAQVFLAYAHHGEKVYIMVSKSKDGEYIAQVMNYMKLNAVRGSTSKGGQQALMEMIQLVKDGRQVGISPDGPRGPAQTVHGGIISVAKNTGVPIVPTAARVRNRIEFNSWDRFVLPLPFSRVVLAHGEPFQIDPNEEEERAKSKVRDALNAVNQKAIEVEKTTLGWWASLVARGELLLYNLLLVGGLVLGLPFIFLRYGIKRSLRNFSERFGKGSVPIALQDKKRIWLHAASLGEWKAMKPLVETLSQKKELDLIMTVITSEAKDIIKKDVPSLPVFLIPLDFSFVLKKWIKKVNPTAVLIAETEIWPNLYHLLYQSNIPLFIVNGRLSSQSVKRWKWAKPFIPFILEGVSKIYARSQEDAGRFQDLGVHQDRIVVTGNLKLDELVCLENEDQKIVERHHLFGFKEGTIFIAGSTREGEEELLLKALTPLSTPSLRIIIAPRHLSRVKHIEKLLKSQPRSWTLWSKIRLSRTWLTDILLVDTLGDLNAMYQTTDVAFVGGSLVPKGGQNPLEPAAARNSVVFGPSMDNFKDESGDLLHHKAAIQVKDEIGLESWLKEFLNKQSEREAMGQAGVQRVKAKQGVRTQILNDLLTLI